MSQITDNLKQAFGPKLILGQDLAKYTTFKIGGSAQYFLEAKTGSDLITAVSVSEKYGLPFLLLGGGSNVLLSDGGWSGLFIKNTFHGYRLAGIKAVQTKNSDSVQEVYIKVASGTPMNQFVRYTIEESLTGLEMHLGLPGTVGGAVAMNSKWSYPDAGHVGDCVYQAVIMDKSGRIRTVSRDYFNFRYGYSRLQETGEIVLEVIFKLGRGDKDKIWDIGNRSINHRRQSQPQGVFCAGCIFKNISQSQALIAKTPKQITSAGFLIDKAGLKGQSIGGAKISPAHANFIVNTGGAQAKDVLQLIKLIKETVKSKFNVDLTEEIIYYGS